MKLKHLQLLRPLMLLHLVLSLPINQPLRALLSSRGSLQSRGSLVEGSLAKEEVKLRCCKMACLINGSPVPLQGPEPMVVEGSKEWWLACLLF
jgi:hypothetical protein